MKTMVNDPSKRGYLGLQFQLIYPRDCWLSAAMFSECSQETLNPDFGSNPSFFPPFFFFLILAVI